MKHKSSLRLDDPEQSKRFLAAAKGAGVDEWQTAFEEAFAWLAVRKGTSKRKKEQASPSTPRIS
jgi:hypothetical protein